jgi:hypothetical protein
MINPFDNFSSNARDSNNLQPSLSVQVQDELRRLPPGVVAVTCFALGSLTTVGVTLVYKRYGRRLQNSDWITPDILARKKWIKGVVTS